MRWLSNNNSSWIRSSRKQEQLVRRRHYSSDNRYVDYHQPAEELRPVLDKLEAQNSGSLDSTTLWSLLWACLNSRALPEGRRVHALVKRKGGVTEQELSKQLVQMYLKCGSLSEARELIHRLRIGDVVTWTRLISAYAQKGQCICSLRAYQEMLSQGVRPNKITVVTILNACMEERYVPDVSQIQSNVAEMGFISDAVVCTVLMNLHSRLGQVEEATDVFRGIQSPDVVSWNALIWLYTQNELQSEALQLFSQMQLHGFSPTKVSFLAVFNACGGGAAAGARHARRMHSLLETSGIPHDVTLGNALVDMYGKSGLAEEAFSVFSCMEELDVISWTAMVAAYVESGDTPGAVTTFRLMQLQGVLPNKVTLVTLLDSQVKKTSSLPLSVTEQVLSCSEEIGLDSDLVLATALVSTLGKSGAVERAKAVFNRVSQKDVVLWTVLIGAYVENGLFRDGLTLFHRMELEGQPPNKASFIVLLEAIGNLQELDKGRKIHARIQNDGYVILGNALINMYIRCGDWNAARECFRSMPRHDESSWNVIMSGAGSPSASSPEQVCTLFHEMQLLGHTPNKITLLALINACARLPTSLARAGEVHARAAAAGFETDCSIANALVDMYCKCGSVEEATRVFMSSGLWRHGDVVSWNALIGGNGQHGSVEVAVRLFRLMQLQGVAPTGVSLVGVLSSMSAGGLVEEGCRVFGTMWREYGAVPGAEHECCVVDLLSRVGWIEEAHEFLVMRKSERGGEDEEETATGWLTLLGACNLHGEVGRGEYAAQRLLELDPNNSAGHVILSNILTSS